MGAPHEERGEYQLRALPDPTSVLPLVRGGGTKSNLVYLVILSKTQNDKILPLLFKEGLGVVDINPSQPPLGKGRGTFFIGVYLCSLRQVQGRLSERIVCRPSTSSG